MPNRTVHLSERAEDEFRRIPKGKRSRVISEFLESRALDDTTTLEGLSGHELVDMVLELRQMMQERTEHLHALRQELTICENRRVVDAQVMGQMQRNAARREEE